MNQIDYGEAIRWQRSQAWRALLVGDFAVFRMRMRAARQLRHVERLARQRQR